MAKKAELLEKAQSLGLEVTEKNTIPQIEKAIKNADKPAKDKHEAVEEKVDSEEPKTAKAGKRSAKALKEAEEKAEKEARKEAGDTSAQGEAKTTTEKKGPAPKARTHLERKGKNYRKAAEQIEKGKSYSLKEALELATKTNPAKFDASVEVHVGLGVDPRQADQNIRSTVTLPHGTGKKITVAVFAPEDEHKKAREAGADIVGEDDFLQKLEKEQIDFDVLIATPLGMKKLSKYARTLGPKGLMPNPKSGTVDANVGRAVKAAKTGRVEYRVDKQSIVHLTIGKVSFGGDKLNDNAAKFFDSLNSNKPSSIKGTFIKNVHVTTSMGPGIKVDTSTV
jgi:large subunit ribosomal protein L1